MKRNGMFVPATGTLADVVNRARARGRSDLADAVLTRELDMRDAAAILDGIETAHGIAA